MTDDNELPSFFDLHADPVKAVKMDQFKTRLSKNPPAKWVKKNKFANNADYLPIDKHEQMLDSIFQDWKIEVLREGTMFQSVYVTVRLHYFHPVLNEWRFHDGVGAHNVQKDSGESFSVDSIKDAGVKMALPLAKSEAIKDACDHLGKVFGRDLNRKDVIDFTPTYMGKQPQSARLNPPPDKTGERLLEMIQSAPNITRLEKLKAHIVTPEDAEIYDKRYNELR